MAPKGKSSKKVGKVIKAELPAAIANNDNLKDLSPGVNAQYYAAVAEDIAVIEG